MSRQGEINRPSKGHEMALNDQMYMNCNINKRREGTEHKGNLNNG